MAKSGNIGTVFDEYLQKEQQFEQEVTERYLLRNLTLHANINIVNTKTIIPKQHYYSLFYSNKLRNEIRNRNHVNVSDSSSRLPINLEKSRIRNQALLKVCYILL